MVKNKQVMTGLGDLIDKLTITNIRIWMAEDIKRNPNATDKEIADACRITNVANQQRSDLIEAIDELAIAINNGKAKLKNYKTGSTKMYGK